MRSEDVVTPAVPAPDLREIRRYAACDDSADGMIRSLLAELTDVSYRVRYKTFDLRADGDRLDLGFAAVSSKDLAKNLDGCRKLVLFAATLGVAPDKVAAKYARLSPAKALLLQAICTERIEALCDAFCESVRCDWDRAGYTARPRFSAGYGDLPLTLQKEIFTALDCERKIGLTLTEQCLMIPTKSVTAIIGLKPNV